MDDFATRRGYGYGYGTSLIDMAARRPIDPLLDRQANTPADWLPRHLGRRRDSRAANSPPGRLV